MSNINAAFMASPPIQEDVVTVDNKFTDVWKNHFDAISEALGLVVVHDRFNTSKEETPLTIVISMSLVQRNDLDNAIDGAIIYNNTTNRFNFRESGAWWTFTRVAA